MRTRISRLAGKLRSQPVHTTGPRPGGRISSRQRDRVWVKAGSSLIDFAWRTAFRLGFPPARLWWRLTRPRYQGTVVAVYVGSALLLVRSSYRRGWHLPGGGVRRGETPEIAAQRELAEEIGLRAPGLLAVGSTCGTWDGRRDRVNFFELRLAELPELKLDNREVIEARLTSPAELQSMVLTGPLAAYVDKVPNGPEENKR